jgi:hypothetical protein
MLTIRDTQMRAMQSAFQEDLGASVINLLRYKFPAELGIVSDDYLKSLIAQAAAGCEQRGLEAEGELIEFVEALVRDDAHPLDPQRLVNKRDQVLRESASRALFDQLSGLSAPARDGEQDDADTPSTTDNTSNEE